jgi:hypothetical protein
MTGPSLGTQNGILTDTPYGFNADFGDGKGTNPEGLWCKRVGPFG